MISLYISLALKFFFLFTPFFALSMFLAMTAEKGPRERRALAHRVALATIVIAGALLYFGPLIFRVFGITVDAFRIGAGILLLLTAISLMNPKVIAGSAEEDISVVPLAMPVVVGPDGHDGRRQFHANIGCTGKQTNQQNTRRNRTWARKRVTSGTTRARRRCRGRLSARTTTRRTRSRSSSSSCRARARRMRRR